MSKTLASIPPDPPDSLGTAKLLHLQIAEQLTRDIQGDLFPPGSHLPSEREIAGRFGAAQMTVRQALSLLEGKGMIRRRHGKKTEVLSAQEKLTVGLLFGPSLTDETAYFYRALLAAFHEWAPEQNCELKVYDALQIRSAELHPQREPILMQLEHDLKRHELGAIITVQLRADDISPALIQSLPRVNLLSLQGGDLLSDSRAFMEDAIRDHVAHGRRRICYIRTRFTNERTGIHDGRDIQSLRSIAETLGIDEPSVSDFTVNVTMGASSGKLHRLAAKLFEQWKSLPPSERPDALIVGDDIMMRTVSMALTEVGIKTPDELRVICATNDRSDFYYIAKVKRYAFSTSDLVKHAYHLLDLRIKGGELPETPMLLRGRFIPEPQFEISDDDSTNP